MKKDKKVKLDELLFSQIDFMIEAIDNYKKKKTEKQKKAIIKSKKDCEKFMLVISKPPYNKMFSKKSAKAFVEQRKIIAEYYILFPDKKKTVKSSGQNTQSFSERGYFPTEAERIRFNEDQVRWFKAGPGGMT